MKLKLLDLTKTEKGDVELPIQFSEEFRPDLIKRAVVAFESRQRQPYGADPLAGTRPSIETSKRRRHYRGTYGIGISRIPRKVVSRSGTRFNFVGAFSPGTVGGRKAHPPKAEKNWDLKINGEERKKAIRSAIAATLSKKLATERGHRVPDNYPFAITSKVEEMHKTKDVETMLEKLGFSEELTRCDVRKVRAGKGKSRGRKYKNKTGVLFVVSKDCPLLKSGKNIPGVEVTVVNFINAKMLAPGAKPGRLTIFSEAALHKMAAEKLFWKGKKESQKKVKEVRVSKKYPKTAESTKSESKKPKAVKAPAKTEKKESKSTQKKK